MEVLFVGDDWSEDHHDVCLMDPQGQVLAARRLPEGVEGLQRFHVLVGEYVEVAGGVVIGIETDQGMWVQALIAAGYQVFAINPGSVSRYRDRHRIGGGKSDTSDAKMLADVVRTDRHNHRTVAANSELSEAVKVPARAHQNLIWARSGASNALRATLRQYYPGALLAFSDLDDRDTLAVLERAPDPDQGARLSRSVITAALRRMAGNATWTAGRADPGGPACPAAAHHTGAATRTGHGHRFTGRDPGRAEHPDRRTGHRTGVSILSSIRTPRSTYRCQASVRSSAPGCSASSGTTRIGTPTTSLEELCRHVTADRGQRP